MTARLAKVVVWFWVDWSRVAGHAQTAGRGRGPYAGEAQGLGGGKMVATIAGGVGLAVWFVSSRLAGWTTATALVDGLLAAILTMLVMG